MISKKYIFKRLLISSATFSAVVGSGLLIHNTYFSVTNAVVLDKLNPYLQIETINDNADGDAAYPVRWRLSLQPVYTIIDSLLDVGSDGAAKDKEFYRTFGLGDAVPAPVNPGVFPRYGFESVCDYANDRYCYGVIPNLALDRKYLGSLGFITANYIVRGDGRPIGNVQRETHICDAYGCGFKHTDVNGAYVDSEIYTGRDISNSESFVLISGNQVISGNQEYMQFLPYIRDEDGRRPCEGARNAEDPSKCAAGVAYSTFRYDYFAGIPEELTTPGEVRDSAVRKFHITNIASEKFVPSIYHWAMLGVEKHVAESEGRILVGHYNKNKIVSVLPMTYNVGFLYNYDVLNSDLNSAFYNSIVIDSDESMFDIFYEVDYGAEMWGNNFSVVLVPFGSFVQNWTNLLNNDLAEHAVGKSTLDNIHSGLRTLFAPNFAKNFNDNDFYTKKKAWSGGASARLMFHASDLISFGLGYIFQYSDFDTPDYEAAQFSSNSLSHGAFATIELDMGMAGFNITGGYIIDNYVGMRDMTAFTNMAPMTFMTVFDTVGRSNTMHRTSAFANAGDSEEAISGRYLRFFQNLYQADHDRGLEAVAHRMEAIGKKHCDGRGGAAGNEGCYWNGGSSIPTYMVIMTDNAGGDLNKRKETNIDDFTSAGRFGLKVLDQDGVVQNGDFRAYPYGKPITVKPLTKFYQKFSGSRFFGQAQGYINLRVTNHLSLRPSFRVNAQFGKLGDIEDYLDEKYEVKVNKAYFTGDSKKKADDTVNVDELMKPDVNFHALVVVHKRDSNGDVVRENGAIVYKYVKAETGGSVPAFDAENPHKSTAFDAATDLKTAKDWDDKPGTYLYAAGDGHAEPMFEYDNTKIMKHWYRVAKAAFATYAETNNSMSLNVDIDVTIPLVLEIATSSGHFMIYSGLTGGYRILDPRSNYKVYLALPYSLGDKKNIVPLTGDSNSVMYRESHYLGIKFGFGFNTNVLSFSFDYEGRLQGYELTHLGSLVIKLEI